jgi:molybdenum-dependent DNA-binding transcriptional regulator ModE
MLAGFMFLAGCSSGAPFSRLRNRRWFPVQPLSRLIRQHLYWVAQTDCFHRKVCHDTELIAGTVGAYSSHRQHHRVAEAQLQERQFRLLKYDANDVVMFVAAAEAGTLSGAAKELGVPTSTVSRSLTRLEQSLQMLLINRSSKGFALTDAGTEYLESCRHALRALSDGNERSTDIVSTPQG